MSAKQGDGPLGWILREAHEEAEAARHGYFGVEHLLAVLARGRSRFVVEVLADHGATYERAQDAIRVVVGSGRGDGPARDAAALLSTLGIDLDEIRRRCRTGSGRTRSASCMPAPWGGTYGRGDRCAGRR